MAFPLPAKMPSSASVRKGRGDPGILRLVKHASRLFVAAILLGAAMPASAFYIRVHGLITEYFSGDGLRNVQVRLVKDSLERETVFSNWKGEYEVFLERGYDYQVWFYRQDLVAKYVRIDARDVPLFPDVPFYDMDVQMTLFHIIADFSFELFDEPVGMAAYRQTVRNLSWDIDYTERMRAETSRLMVHYERAVGEMRRKERELRRRKRKRAYF
jgi:hypothetical protein